MTRNVLQRDSLFKTGSCIHEMNFLGECRIFAQKMPLDINDFRPEKGGNPDLVRDTIRKRFKDVSIVDAVIASDKKWRESNFKDEEFSKFINKTSKEIGVLKGQKKDAEAALLMEQVKEQKLALEANKKITAEINAQTLKLISSIGNYVHVSFTHECFVFVLLLKIKCLYNDTGIRSRFAR